MQHYCYNLDDDAEHVIADLGITQEDWDSFQSGLGYLRQLCREFGEAFSAGRPEGEAPQVVIMGGAVRDALSGPESSLVGKLRDIDMFLVGGKGMTRGSYIGGTRYHEIRELADSEELCKRCHYPMLDSDPVERANALKRPGYPAEVGCNHVRIIVSGTGFMPNPVVELFETTKTTVDDLLSSADWNISQVAVTKDMLYVGRSFAIPKPGAVLRMVPGVDSVSGRTLSRGRSFMARYHMTIDPEDINLLSSVDLSMAVVEEMRDIDHDED